MRGSGFRTRSVTESPYKPFCGYTRGRQQIQSAIVSVGKLEYHADNAAVHDSHGTVETRLMCGVEFGSFSCQPEPCGEHEGIELRVDSSTAGPVLGALRIVSQQVIGITARTLTVVTVRHAGGGSVVSRREGAAIPRDDRPHWEPRARGVFTPEACHTHQGVVSARFHRWAPRFRWRTMTGAGSSPRSSRGASAPGRSGHPRRCGASRR